MIEVKRKEVGYFPASSDPCLKEGLGLLLDTSSKNLVVGLYKGGILHYVEEKDVLKKQSELLVPSIKALLEEGGFAPLDMAYVVVGKGPGSYTGVRVGLTVAKTVKGDGASRNRAFAFEATLFDANGAPLAA